MARITLPDGTVINTPDGLGKEQYDEIVEDASSRKPSTEPKGIISKVEDFFTQPTENPSSMPWDSSRNVWLMPEETHFAKAREEEDKLNKQLPLLTKKIYNEGTPEFDAFSGQNPKTSLEEKAHEAAENQARVQLNLPPKNWFDKASDYASSLLGVDADRFGNPEGGPVSDKLEEAAMQAEHEGSPVKASVARAGLGASNTFNQAFTGGNIALSGLGGAIPDLGKAIFATFAPGLVKGTLEKGQEAAGEFTGDTPSKGFTPLIEAIAQGLGAGGAVKSGYDIGTGSFLSDTPVALEEQAAPPAQPATVPQTPPNPEIPSAFKPSAAFNQKIVSAPSQEGVINLPGPAENTGKLLPAPSEATWKSTVPTLQQKIDRVSSGRSLDEEYDLFMKTLDAEKAQYQPPAPPQQTLPAPKTPLQLPAPKEMPGPGIDTSGRQAIQTPEQVDPATLSKLFPDLKPPTAPVIRLPERFETSQRALPAPKSLKDMSTVDLLKTALNLSDERGSVSNEAIDPAKIEMRRAATRELTDRARKIASETGETAQDVLDKLKMNPNYGSEPPNTSSTDLPKNYDSIPDTEKMRVWGRQKINQEPGQMAGKKGLFNALLNNGYVMRKMGPAGKLFADALDNASYEHYDQLGKWQVPYEQAVKGVKGKEFEGVVDLLENTPKEGVEYTPQQHSTAIAIKSILADVAGKAKESIPGFEERENYYPHVPNKAFRDYLKTQKGQDFYKDWLKETHPELTPEQRSEMVSAAQMNEDLGATYASLVRAQSKGTAKFGNIYKHRYDVIPDKFLRKDPAVVMEYLDRAAKQIADTKVLGEDMSKIQSLIPQIQNEADRAFGQKVLNNLRSEGKRTVGLDETLRKMTSWSTFLTNWGSSLIHLGQRSNLFGVKGAGMMDVMKALASVYTKEGADFAKSTGLMGRTTRTAMSRFAGVTEGSLAEKHARFVGLESVMEGNRTAAANLGRIVANKMFTLYKSKGSAFAKEVLTEMGIKPEAALKRGSLAPEDLNAAAFGITKSTMGLFRRIDLPNWQTSTQIGRTMGQFKSSADIQTGVIVNAMKNFWDHPQKMATNMLAMLTAMAVTGTATQAFKDTTKGHWERVPLIGGDQSVGGLAQYVLKGLLRSGAGVAGEVASATGEGPEALKNFALGPTLSGILDTAGKSYALLRGSKANKPRKTWGAQAEGKLPGLIQPFTSRIPYVGSMVLPLVFNAAQGKGAIGELAGTAPKKKRRKK